MNSRSRFVMTTMLATVAVTAIAASSPWWRPWMATQLAAARNSNASGAAEPDDHGHDHAAHGDENSIKLSPSALKNINFRPVTVALSPFERTTTLPAMVVERPGRSQFHITAPLTGVITKIVPQEGAAVEPDSEMFEIRLTHEELVAAQRDFLQTAESLDVVNREIARLESLTEGVVAGRRVLEQQYERQKLEASLRADQQGMLLHGLSNEQIDGILKTRQLVQTLVVKAPPHTHDDDECGGEHLFHAQQLPVKLGQQVEAGELLCVLADHCELYIEGRAFEDDAERLREAARAGLDVTARLLAGDRQTDRVEGLKLLYLADSIDPETRAFHFYLRLPNEVVLDRQAPGGQRFLSWRFQPGQRLELSVPVEKWTDRIVLPVEAVVLEGAENYVYRQNGDRFDRVAVHVEHRDQTSAVIANDGAIFPGDIVAASGAYQMHLALKNKSGGAIDPHAGHNH